MKHAKLWSLKYSTNQIIKLSSESEAWKNISRHEKLKIHHRELASFVEISVVRLLLARRLILKMIAPTREEIKFSVES